ncbi:hypothetical protein JL720_10599 [Aureococcus anophagefferens]|nr:hypothetical protein JL720_10599 [Aureococcus anophagefferens]
MSARDRAKERELAEARQNGQAAPEVDVNSGAMINPHNPDFITKRPWYLGDSGPSLQHHDTRGAATASEVSMAEADAHLRRGRGAWDARVGGGAVAVVEVGAWIEALYRGKTPWLPARVAKRQRQRQRRQRRRGDDEFRLGDAEAGDFQKRIARQGGVGGAQMKTTVRNLRIREDTAKYLRNLDPDSAFYDPKTRAMRENPTPNVDPKDLVYAGDNFARATGDALELAATHCFAWDVERKGASRGGDALHVQADPSRAELEKKKFEAKKAALDREKQQAILDKYGAQDVDEDAAERQLRAAGAASEAYREFDARGNVTRGAPLQKRASKYAEDVFDTNHTADVVLDEAKVQAAMARARAAPNDAADDANDKKRKYNSFATTDVTAEDMEARRRTRVAADDP